MNSLWFGRSESAPPRGPNPYEGGSTDVDDIFDLFGQVHEFYDTRFGRDGANGLGGLGDGANVELETTMAYAHLNNLGWGYPGAWYGFGKLSFTHGMVAPDIFAHEYSHGVVHHAFLDGSNSPVGLVYSGESGALEENFSDLMAEAFEGGVTGDNDWILGVGTTYGPFRNMADPKDVVQEDIPILPDRYHDPDLYTGSDDNGGVHWNSTIPSKAMYLASEGGSFNGYEIRGIGMDKVVQIWYRALTSYYVRSETFNGAYHALIQAATDLYDTADAAEVRKALQAVEMDLPPRPAGPAVTGRYVFYNNSILDGDTPGADARDDEAIATNKRPVLTFPTRLGPAVSANYTNYSRGINGIMVDVDDLPAAGQLSADDFTFRVGNSNDSTAWTPVDAAGITVRPVDLRDDGTIDVDRVTIIFPDNAIRDQWLEVKVLPTADTGLTEPDVFYFGNAAGQTGLDDTDTLVNAADVIAIRDNPRGQANPAAIDDPHDINRDQSVDATDMILARNNATSPLSALRLIELTQPAAPAPMGEGEATFATRKLDSATAPSVATLDGLMAAEAYQTDVDTMLPPATLSKLLRRFGSTIN